MNVVHLLGRLTKDVEVTYTQSENPMAIARFTLAVNKERKPKDGEQTADFITCVAFGKSAETIEKYFSKGDRILVKGSWSTGSYQNKDGNRVYTNDCLVHSFEFIETRGSKSESNTNPSVDSPEANGFFVPSGLGEVPFK